MLAPLSSSIWLQQCSLIYSQRLVCETFISCLILVVDQEEMQKQMQMLSNDIQSRERAVGEIDQTLRDFDTYLAVKEGAITLEGLHEVIKTGGDDPAKEGT